jgi:hypothetical protein
LVRIVRPLHGLLVLLGHPGEDGPTSRGRWGSMLMPTPQGTKFGLPVGVGKVEMH